MVSYLLTEDVMFEQMYCNTIKSLSIDSKNIYCFSKKPQKREIQKNKCTLQQITLDLIFNIFIQLNALLL